MSLPNNKTCSSCQRTLSRTAFNNNRTRKDGLQNVCKACMKTYQKSLGCHRSRESYRTSDHGKQIVKECCKRYKASDKGRIAERRYRQSEKGLTYDRCQKQRRRDPATSLTVADISVVLEKFNNTCFNCGSYEDICIDHHRPLAKGFSLSLENAVVLCKRCNSSKCDKMPDEFYTPEQLMELEVQYVIATS